MIRIALGSVPKAGGTYTFYQNMRGPLREHGFDLRCVSVGRKEARLWEQSFSDEGCVLLAEKESDTKRQARVFTDWAKEHDVSIVIGVNSVAILSALPHLPENIRVISRCANAFDHGYRITMSCHERLSRIIALNPRQVYDLTNYYQADGPSIVLIPNGASVNQFGKAASKVRGEEPVLRLGFLGRLEHQQKGILFLPEILSGLREADVEFSLKIAGKGIHEKRLRSQIASFIDEGSVEFTGPLQHEEIAEYFSDIDIYLFPSLFEGSPNALIEAMMAGCVPVAWRLNGITDFVIEDGCTGVLSGVGDCEGMANSITRLSMERSLLAEMSREAAQTAITRFSGERVVSDYVALLQKVMKEPPMPWSVKSWDDFRVDPAFEQPRWKELIPDPVKQVLKATLLRLNLGGRYE